MCTCAVKSMGTAEEDVFMKLALSSHDFPQIGGCAGHYPQRRADLDCKYRQQNSGQVQGLHFLALWDISGWLPLSSAKTRPETWHTVSE